MSGGSGTRLWPISTPTRPKQFHALATQNTMIQETVLRLKHDCFLPPIVICGAGHQAHAIEQLREIGCTPSKIILEPFGRNTAAVAAIGAICAAELGPDVLALLLPADHVVTKPEAFVEAILSAQKIAQTHIVTFGITPTKPETGFGYIEQGDKLGDGIYEIKQFLEKPNQETAQSYIDGGRHFWNAGIFLYSPQIMQNEMQSLANDVLIGTKDAYENGVVDQNITSLSKDDFAQTPSISIDYAIMEKTKYSAVVPCDIGWADVGSFAEIWRLGAKDENGNHAPANAIFIESKNNLVIGGDIPISLIGLENIMVIVSPEGILVAPTNRSQDVKLAYEMVAKKPA